MNKAAKNNLAGQFDWRSVFDQKIKFLLIITLKNFEKALCYHRFTRIITKFEFI